MNNIQNSRSLKSQNLTAQEISSLSTWVEQNSYHLQDADDLSPLLEIIKDAKVVLLGEASHGTHEYYSWRAYLTQKLLTEKNFSFMAVEGDWPDCYNLNRFIKNYPHAAPSPLAAVQNFTRWPSWMWCNWEMVALLEWMKNFNREKGPSKHVGFYGLDVYGLWESLETITNYLKQMDSQLFQKIQETMNCFEPYKTLGWHHYAKALAQNIPHSCEQEVLDLLGKIQKETPQAFIAEDPEAKLSAEQNALVAVDAERYYRSMLYQDETAWNIRDHHMMDTLKRLLNFHGPDAKAIVWEHNTHIGDARATDMAFSGLVNVGQLAREHFGAGEVVSVGFGSYEGSVMAGQFWGDRMKKMVLPPAKEGSWEHILHQARGMNRLLLSERMKGNELLLSPLDHRAVGVVYRPEAERRGNYVPSILPSRYDAFIFLNQTQALHPVLNNSFQKTKEYDHEREQEREREIKDTEMPDTFPWGI